MGKERAELDLVVSTIDKLYDGLADSRELVQLAQDEDDEELFAEVNAELGRLGTQLESLEFRRMFSGRMDPNSAFVDIQAGSGGTEAQDWAEMLLRMYLRWGEAKGFKVEVVEVSAGEVAGIKSATLSIRGENAFGWLRSETGVHRLVPKSPFDSGNRRHTSFSAVFVSPALAVFLDLALKMSP